VIEAPEAIHMSEIAESNASTSADGTNGADRLQDIKSALKAWHLEANAVLSADPRSHVVVVPTEQEEWELVSPGFYLKRPTSFTAFTAETLEELKQMTTYSELEEAARQSTFIGPLFGEQIGTHMAAVDFDVWLLASAMIPDTDQLAQGIEVEFEAQYAALSRLFTDLAEYTTVCPIQGVSFSEDRIELAPGLTIEKLTDNEVKLALRQGVVSPLFGPSSASFKLGEAHSFALKKAWATKDVGAARWTRTL
jgi:hypothetical protein